MPAAELTALRERVTRWEAMLRRIDDKQAREALMAALARMEQQSEHLEIGSCSGTSGANLFRAKPPFCVASFD
jgi:predicted O-methyltransferase YrrM